LSSFNSSDVLWENLLYFILRLIVLFPVYQLLLIVVGSLFFQHQ
jgi:K+-transporting ATPase c subunit